MYNEQLESLINAALADGELTEKEKQVLFKKAQSLGVDLDEFEMVLDARLVTIKKEEEEKAAQSAPKSNKYGDVRKCPVCGAIVQAYIGSCPECGYEFNNVAANSSSKKLADEIKSAKNLEEQKHAIELFPIPIAKADLLEFLTSLNPKMKDVKDPLASSYFKKYQECINKAKLSFPKDPLFSGFIESFESECKSLKKKQSSSDVGRWLSSHIKLVVAAVILILLLLAYGVYSYIDSMPDKDEDALKKVVAAAIAKGDLAKAQDYIDSFHGVQSWARSSYASLCAAYVKNGEIDKALSLAEKYAPYGNGKCDMGQSLYNYFLANKQYDKMEEYVYYCEYRERESAEAYYKYIKDCVEDMCNSNNQVNARKFIKRKVTFFQQFDNKDNYYHKDWNSFDVQKRLNAIVDNY